MSCVTAPKPLGRVKAIVAAFGEPLNSRVLLPGAFPDGSPVGLYVLRHWSEGGQMVGTGRLHIDGADIILDGHFSMHSAAGRAAFTLLRDLGERCTGWSLAWDTIEAGEQEINGRTVEAVARAFPFEVTCLPNPAFRRSRTLELR